MNKTNIEIPRKYFDNYRANLSLQNGAESGFINVMFGYDKEGIADFATYIKTNTKHYFGLNYVFSGEGVFIDENNNKHHIKAGTLFYRIPGKIHTTKFFGNEEYAEATIGLDFSAYKYFSNFGFIDDRRPVQYIGVSKSILEEFYELYYFIKKGISRSNTSRIIKIQEFLIFLNKQVKKRMFKDDRYQQLEIARKLLNKNCCTDIELAKIAKKAKLNYETFRKNFKETYGVSPSEYKIKKRLDKACTMLLSTSIKDVAFKLNYSDQYTFSNQFKRYIGMSPKKYRNMITQEY